MSVQYLPTDQQVADVLTKALHGPKTAWGRLQMGLVELPEPSRGRVNMSGP
jgi:hypothetical protein